MDRVLVGDAVKGELEIGDKAVVEVTQSVDVQPKGTLKGKANVKGKVKDNGGKISAAPGTSTIEGSYAQSDSGVLEIEIAGRQLDQFANLNILGPASIATGSVFSFLFTDGFLPENGDAFTFLTSTSLSITDIGTIKTDVFGVAPGFQYVLEPTSQTLTFRALSTAQAVPEPSTLALAIAGIPCLIGCIWWSRRPGTGHRRRAEIACSR